MSNRLLHNCFIFILLIATAFSSKSYAETTSLELGLDLKIKVIAIDPGFGGKDLGPPGCKEGLYANQINLEIAKILADKIKNRLELDIIMTRTEDEFVPLDQRVYLAHRGDADLFISIHCNAHEDPKVYGIETYFLNMIPDERAVEVAARENATSEKNIEDLQEIIFYLMLNTKINESQLLAELIQSSLCNHMLARYGDIKNRGIKQAPFYVLIGTEIPAILINVSFISNKRECERLMTEKYQTDLAEGIFNGIENFILKRKNNNK